MSREVYPFPSLSGPGSALEPHSWARKKRSKDNKKTARAATIRRLRRMDSSKNKGVVDPESDSNSSPTETTGEEGTKFIGGELLEWHDENTSPPNDPSKEEEEKPDTHLLHDKKQDGNDGRNDTRHRALGLDTRFLEANPNSNDGDHLICRRYEQLVQTLNRRGTPPNIVSSTQTKDGDKQIRLLTLAFDEREATRIRAVAIPPSEKQHSGLSTTPSTAVRVPSSLGAKGSWKLFGSIVDSIASKADDTTNSSPLEVTIVTTDLAVFCDLHEDAHKKGVGDFVNAVTPHFRKGRLGDVRIFVAISGKLALADGDANKSTAANQSRYDEATRRCIHAIQIQLQMAVNERSRDVGTAGRGRFQRPVCVTLAPIHHSPTGYKYVSRHWVRSASIRWGIGSTRLQLHLPELVDGTQCSVCLDASYQILPFAVNSKEHSRLMTDLRLLKNSKMTVTQVLPFSSLDASLLFGVPVSVKAGLQADFYQSQEMDVLVRSLFQHLSGRQLVLLLDVETTYADAQLGDPLFPHKTYVLLPQTPSASQVPSHTGLLFHYARSDQLVLEASTASRAGLLDEDTERQYMEYIESAMESCEIKADNPLDATVLEDEYLRMTSSKQESERATPTSVAVDLDSTTIEGAVETPNTDHAMDTSAVADDEDGFWNDSVGVGSRAAAAKSDDDGEAGSDEEMANEDNDPDQSFDYM